MNNVQREVLIHQLRAFEKGSSGLVLNTPSHWVIEHLKDPDAFFANLRLLISADSVLCFEGTTIAPEVANFYTHHRSLQPTEVRPDTVYPIPEIYHVSCSEQVVSGLRESLRRRPIKEMFDHVKAYRSGALLFTFHDAFAGVLRISEHVAESAVKNFCMAIGVSYRSETTLQHAPNQFRALLFALENPDKVRIRIQPWWRRSSLRCATFLRKWLTRKIHLTRQP